MQESRFFISSAPVCNALHSPALLFLPLSLSLPVSLLHGCTERRDDGDGDGNSKRKERNEDGRRHGRKGKRLPHSSPPSPLPPTPSLPPSLLDADGINAQ